MKYTRHLTFIALAAVIGALYTAQANAQETTGTPTPPPQTRPAINQQFQGQRKEIIQNAQSQKKMIMTDGKAAIKDARMSSTTGTSTIKDLRNDMQGKLQDNRNGMIGDLRENHEKKLEATKAMIDARKKELAAELAKKKEAKKQKLNEAAKKRVQGQANIIFTAFANQLGRLDEIDAKVGVRINASTTPAGVDMAAAKTQYAIAQTSLIKAKADVEAAKTLVTEQTNTTTSSTTLKTLIKTAEGSIKKSGEEYRKTLKLLTPNDEGLFSPVPPSPGTSTSTPTATTTASTSTASTTQ